MQTLLEFWFGACLAAAVVRAARGHERSRRRWPQNKGCGSHHRQPRPPRLRGCCLGEEEGTRDGEDESGDEGVFLGDLLRRQPAAGGHGDGARGLQMGQTKYPEPHLLGWAKPRILLFTDVVVGCEMNGDVRFTSLGGSFNYVRGSGSRDGGGGAKRAAPSVAGEQGSGDS